MPERRKKVVVVIVNYKTANLVIECLVSLLPQLAELDAQVVVVDNNSPDDSLARIQAWVAGQDASPLVQIIGAAVNAGFAAGNNVGICAINADYYLLLNSDTIVRPRAIAVLLETADHRPSAGIVSPRLEWPDATPQESCFRFLSPISELVLAAQTAPITALFKKYVVPFPVTDQILYPHWTSFACVLLRHEMVDEIGLMDDGFFMYFEDVEYCRRARKSAWQIVHNPQARVVHLRGGSSPVKKRALERKRLPRYYYAARTRYLHLAYGRFGLTLANILWLLGRGVSKSREILERRGLGVPEKQWLDIWTNWINPATPWSQQKSSTSNK